jgi:hypothetical protein
LERPDTYNGREFMTDEEAAAEQKKLLDRQVCGATTSTKFAFGAA